MEQSVLTRWVGPGRSRVTFPPMVVLLGCLGWLSACSCLGQAETDRPKETWTHRDGREMTARLVGADGESVEFLLPDGRTAKIPLTDLVEPDRDRVEAFRRWQHFWTGETKRGDWPERVMLNWLEGEVETVEGTDEGQFVYRTAHFQFEADAKLAPNLVRDFARIFEVTHAALEKNPLGLSLYRPPRGHHVVRLFKDTRGYQRAGGLLNTAGVYNRRSQEILVPFRSLGLRKANVAWVRQGKVYDPTTLIHEVTHQLLDHWLEVAPIWFNEGFADLIGSARYDSGRLFFNRLHEGIKERLLGKQKANPRVRDLGPSGFEFPIDPAEVLLASQAGFMGYPPAPPIEHGQVLHHYHSSLLLVHFALNEGESGAARLGRYLEAHRKAVEESGLRRLKIPDRASTEAEREKLARALVARAKLQHQVAARALPVLSGGRSPEDFLEAMADFYRPLGIHLKPSRPTP